MGGVVAVLEITLTRETDELMKKKRRDVDAVPPPTTVVLLNLRNTPDDDSCSSDPITAQDSKDDRESTARAGALAEDNLTPRRWTVAP
jgi:hypothetical protein